MSDFMNYRGSVELLFWAVNHFQTNISDCCSLLREQREALSRSTHMLHLCVAAEKSHRALLISAYLYFTECFWDQNTELQMLPHPQRFKHFNLYSSDRAHSNSSDIIWDNLFHTKFLNVCRSTPQRVETDYQIGGIPLWLIFDMTLFSY